ncbi:hypothetical protein ACHQM5_025206 [Ranunculus cassubicifolius]
MAETSERRRRKQKHVNNGDRISSLPEPIIHHILSNLNMRDVVQSSILSNTWRYIWMSSPTLNFRLDEWKHTLSTGPERENRFIMFMAKVLTHGGSSPLEKFNLSFFPARINTIHVQSWVIKALARNVRHIDLEVSLDKFLDLPCQLFTLSVRELRLCCLNGPLIRLPSSICNAVRVRSMELFNVQFPGGNERGELILSCPVLQHLTISSCGLSRLKKLSIFTPLLESLNLDYLYTMKNTSCTVKTSTPALKSLKVSARLSVDLPSVHYCMENLSSLISAYVNTYATGDDLKKARADCLINVLSMISNVQALKVSALFVETFADFPHLLELLPRLFPNVRHVMLMDVCENISTFLSILEKLPLTEALVWDKYQLRVARTKKGRDWLAKASFQNIFNCLRTFEMRNFHGTVAEHKFLEFLFKRALVLEEVIIKTFKHFRRNKSLPELRRRLSDLPRASLSAIIHVS